MDACFKAGPAARNAIAAARLAMAGAISSRVALEGDYGFFAACGGVPGGEDEVLAERTEYDIERVGAKRFGACLQNPLAVALIVDGLDRPLSAGEIAAVRIARGATETHGLNSPGVSAWAPHPNMLSAQMSARFSTVSGAPRVTRLCSFDCGLILSPKTATIEFRLGIIMGLGLAVMEETQHLTRTGYAT